MNIDAKLALLENEDKEMARKSFERRAERRKQLRYRRVDMTTLQGLKQAERLHTSGLWKQIQVTPFSITFERKSVSNN